jgi:hypothetical protein
MTTQEAKSLLTKFFYSGNHLNFQILIQTEDNLVMHGEYSDYGLYKTAFDMIQFNLNNEIRVLSVAEKNVRLETAFAKVA